MSKNVNKKIPIHAVFVRGESLVRRYSKTVGLDFEYSVFSYVLDVVFSELYSSSDTFSVHLTLKALVYHHQRL